MTKNVINQKGKFDEELINTIEPNFIFNDKPINRFNIVENSNNLSQTNKTSLLEELKNKINSIENCSLKDNSQNLVLGDGNMNSPIMLIGEAPGIEEDKIGITFISGEITYQYGTVGVKNGKVVDFRRNILYESLLTRKSRNYIAFNYAGISLINSRLLNKYKNIYKKCENFEQKIFPKLINNGKSNFVIEANSPQKFETMLHYWLNILD